MADRPGETVKEIAAHIVKNCDRELIDSYLTTWKRESSRAARSLAWYGRRLSALRKALADG